MWRLIHIIIKTVVIMVGVVRAATLVSSVFHERRKLDLSAESSAACPGTMT